MTQNGGDIIDKRVILYSTGCPMCDVLKTKMDEAGIAYQECNSLEDMEKLNITAVPVVDNGEELLSFREAIEWVKAKEGE